jgi:hypothetical protein
LVADVELKHGILCKSIGQREGARLGHWRYSVATLKPDEFFKKVKRKKALSARLRRKAVARLRPEFKRHAAAISPNRRCSASVYRDKLT